MAINLHQEQWTQRLAIMVDQLAEQDRTLHKRLTWLLDMLRSTQVTITFGGHFSSGKSTILNAALGRPLLPVDELPETGALCLLRSGTQDTAQVIGTHAAGRLNARPVLSSAPHHSSLPRENARRRWTMWIAWN